MYTLNNKSPLPPPAPPPPPANQGSGAGLCQVPGARFDTGEWGGGGGGVDYAGNVRLIQVYMLPTDGVLPVGDKVPLANNKVIIYKLLC